MQNMNPNPDTPKPTTTFHVDMWDYDYYNLGTPEEWGRDFYWEDLWLPSGPNGGDTDRFWCDGHLIRWVMEVEVPSDLAHLWKEGHRSLEICDAVWDACRVAMNRAGWDFEASALPGPDIQEVGP